jgi:hypothetical protein
MLSVSMLSVSMLSVIMLNVIILSANILSVVAPLIYTISVVWCRAKMPMHTPTKLVYE